MPHPTKRHRGKKIKVIGVDYARPNFACEEFLKKPDVSSIIKLNKGDKIIATLPWTCGVVIERMCFGRKVHIKYGLITGIDILYIETWWRAVLRRLGFVK